MIKVKIGYKDHIDNIKIDGHAMYDEYGKDIVCAGVSSIVTTTVNAILRFDKTSIKYEVKNGFVFINVLEDTKEVKILLENMIDLLKDLEKKYEKNIKIEEVYLS